MVDVCTIGRQLRTGDSFAVSLTFLHLLLNITMDDGKSCRRFVKSAVEAYGWQNCVCQGAFETALQAFEFSTHICLHAFLWSKGRHGIKSF